MQRALEDGRGEFTPTPPPPPSPDDPPGPLTLPCSPAAQGLPDSGESTLSLLLKPPLPPPPPHQLATHQHH